MRLPCFCSRQWEEGASRGIPKCQHEEEVGNRDGIAPGDILGLEGSVPLLLSGPCRLCVKSAVAKMTVTSESHVSACTHATETQHTQCEALIHSFINQ